MKHPNFLVIGAQKCGTTALYQALRRHPQIFMSPIKEPFYFLLRGSPPAYSAPNQQYADRLRITEESYLDLFRDAGHHKAVGEASALYLSSYFPERTAAAIHEFDPKMKLIALLRQPVDRAWSSFHYYRSRGYEPLRSFDAALAAEATRRSNGGCPDLWHWSNGRYFTNLKPYFECFPREQIHVCLYEDLNHRPHEALQDIFDFLGVDRSAEITLKRMNVTSAYRSLRLKRFLDVHDSQQGLWKVLPERLYGAACRRLANYNRRSLPELDSERWWTLTESCRVDIEQLQTLIDRDLSHWFARNGKSS